MKTKKIKQTTKQKDYNYIILQCPRCKRIKRWARKHGDGGPGYCACKSFQFWNVLKEEPKRIIGGYVKVMSDKGYQYLHGPSFIEDPNGWIKEKKKNETSNLPKK